MRPVKKALVTGFVITLACVSTTGVVAPGQVAPECSFQAVVTVEADTWGSGWGNLGVLLPIGWDADSVSYEGPNGINGQGFYDQSLIYYIECNYPCSPSDHWIGFATADRLSGDAGDIYEITLTINTDTTTGPIDIAFLAYIYWGTTPPSWHGDPCTTTVDVTSPNLELWSWGRIKTAF